MTQPQELFRLLSANDHTIAVAESCTGGGIASAITTIAGVSKIFLGSVTAYANTAKENILRVDKNILAAHGAVSEEVATLMAKNCREIFGADWSIATTGIAGPGGGTDDKPVGTVWIGLCGPNICRAQKFIFANVSREQHRTRCIERALGLMIDALGH